MCIKHVIVCCHCGDVMDPSWDSCNFHLLLSRIAPHQDSPTGEPLHSECPYQSIDMLPVLRGCVNNDSCSSWLWSVSRGFGESGDKSLEFTEAEAELAKEKYEEYKKEFAEDHYARRSLPVRKNFGAFLEAALGDMDTDTDESSVEMSFTDDDEEDELASETDSSGCLPGHLKASTAPPDLSVRLEINPKLHPRGNMAPKKHDRGLGSGPSTTENLAIEYRNLIAPVWAWFYPNDSDADTEVSR